MWQRAPQWHRVIGEPLLATTKPLCADLHDLSRTIRVVLKTQVPDDHPRCEEGPLIPHPPYWVQPEGMAQTDTKKVEIFAWFVRGICGAGAATMRTTPRGRVGWRW